MEIVIQSFQKGKPSQGAMQSFVQDHSAVEDGARTPETRGETSLSSHCSALPAGVSTGAHEPPAPGAAGSREREEGEKTANLNCCP